MKPYMVAKLLAIPVLPIIVIGMLYAILREAFILGTELVDDFFEGDN